MKLLLPATLVLAATVRERGVQRSGVVERVHLQRFQQSLLAHPGPFGQLGDVGHTAQLLLQNGSQPAEAGCQLAEPAGRITVYAMEFRKTFERARASAP